MCVSYYIIVHIYTCIHVRNPYNNAIWVGVVVVSTHTHTHTHTHTRTCTYIIMYTQCTHMHVYIMYIMLFHMYSVHV